jgi:hypothetical protein
LAKKDVPLKQFVASDTFKNDGECNGDTVLNADNLKTVGTDYEKHKNLIAEGLKLLKVRELSDPSKIALRQPFLDVCS